PVLRGRGIQGEGEQRPCRNMRFSPGILSPLTLPCPPEYGCRGEYLSLGSEIPAAGSRTLVHTLMTILPVRVPALPTVFSSCRRWAAAASAREKERPITGWSFLSPSQRLMSSAARRCSSGVALNRAKPRRDRSFV